MLGGFFACQPFGTRPVKGIAQPLAVYRVLYESMARSRLEAAGGTSLTTPRGPGAGVACRLYAAATLWLLGYPAQALAYLHEALTLAHALIMRSRLSG